MSRSKPFIHSNNTPPKQFVREISQYGLYSPSNQRKTLIDQIINNCKMIESPRPPLMQRPSSSALNNSAKPIIIEDKENHKRVPAYIPLDQLDSKRRRSHDKRYSSSKRSSVQSSKHQTLQERKPSRNCSEQYYIQAINPKQTPIQPMTACQGSLKHKASFSKRGLKLRSQIEKERQQHVTHCRQEERKLKAYFAQLQNKLKEIKNQEFKTFKEYERSKLIQLEELMKETENQFHEGEYEDLEKRIEEVKKHEKLKVEEDEKIEVKGCLKTEVNGMFFSFDQCVWNERLG